MLDKSLTEKLVHAFFLNLPSNQLKQLHLVQNSAARLTTGPRVRESITPVRRNLHWLPVGQRIRCKILVITYDIIDNVTAPIYLWLASVFHRDQEGRVVRFVWSLHL